jgi:hypothetical protein
MDIEKIAPAYIGEQRLRLALRDLNVRPRVGLVLVLTVDYSDTAIELGGEPVGVVLPLIYTVTQPDGSKLVERIYERVPPTVLDFVPELSGRHMVRIGEAFHNRWWGSTFITVVGDQRDA